MITEEGIEKDLIRDIDESRYISSLIRKRMVQKDSSYSEIARIAAESFKKSYSSAFVGKVLKGESKGNGINLYHFAYSVGITKTEFLKIAFEARVSGVKKGNSDIMPDIGDFSVLDADDLEEVLLSKNSIKLSDDAKSDLRSYIEFLKNKYPKK